MIKYIHYIMILISLYILLAFATPKSVLINGIPVALGEFLGKGQFAAAYLTKEDQPKVVKFSLMTPDEETVFRSQKEWPRNNEAAILKKQDLLIDHYFQEGKEVIVMKKLQGYKMLDLYKMKKITIADLPTFKTALIEEANRIHQLGIVHRDIHEDNILFVKENSVGSGKSKVKAHLIDFGLSIDLTTLGPASSRSKSVIENYQDNDWDQVSKTFTNIRYKIMNVRHTVHLGAQTDKQAPSTHSQKRIAINNLDSGSGSMKVPSL